MTEVLVDIARQPASPPEDRSHLPPSLRWPGFFEALCLAEIRPDGIDNAEIELREGVTDTLLMDRWSAFQKGESEYETVEELVHASVIFPERKPAVPPQRSYLRLGDYSKLVMEKSVHSAHLTIGTQIGVSKEVPAPGGRFDDRKPGRGRLFYWDCLWTLYGAVAACGGWGKKQVDNTISNFRELAEKLGGNIPNVNTTWGKYRSHPPILARLLGFKGRVERGGTSEEDLALLEKHFMYWHEGADDPDKLGHAPKSHYRRVVRMPNGIVMYRFYDDGPDQGRVFRDEMYLKDMEIMLQLEKAIDRRLTPAEKKKFTIDMAAGAEDGEDYTGNNCKDYTNLYTICTTDLVSVKLNALQYDAASKLAYEYDRKVAAERDPAKRALLQLRQSFFATRAKELKEGIQTYCVAENGFPANYDFVEGKTRRGQSMTGVFALSSGIFPQEQGEKMLETMERLFLREGGFINTLYDTDMQWDGNVWPLMQMEAVLAAIKYGRHDLALKWTLLTLKNNVRIYEKHGVLFEKTHPDKPGEPGGDGEYACVRDLLMSHGVDMALRGLLPWLLTMVASNAKEKPRQNVKPLHETGEALGNAMLKALAYMHTEEGKDHAYAKDLVGADRGR